MKSLRDWFVTRRLETILWFSALLGSLTFIPMIGIIVLDSVLPEPRFSWWVVLFFAAWMISCLWSAVAVLCMHHEYNVHGLLLARVHPRDETRGDHERIRQMFKNPHNLQLLQKRWKMYTDSHMTLLTCAIVGASFRFLTSEHAEPGILGCLTVMTILAAGFALMPLVIRAQFHAAGLTLRLMNADT